MDVVCEVWIILSTEGTYLPGALFVLSLHFPTYVLVMPSSLAVEFLFFSFVCNIVPIVSNELTREEIIFMCTVLMSSGKKMYHQVLL